MSTPWYINEGGQDQREPMEKPKGDTYIEGHSMGRAKSQKVINQPGSCIQMVNAEAYMMTRQIIQTM